jgi:non-specific protein-tyrosine kinase
VTALGFSVGIVLAGITVWLIEIWGDAIETSEQATQTLGYSVLATITRFGRPGDQYPDRLITLHTPHSPIAEQYRTLRTNLLFSSGSHGKKAFIITSPGPAEGKSITTANLAIALADAGLRVLLIDADLRRPRLHEIFGAPNESGLTRLSCTSPDRIRVHGQDWDRLAISLTPELEPQTLGEESRDGTCFECLQHTGIPGLRLITSGSTSPKPADVLGSSRMRKWFNAFMSAENIDVILFDTPPTLTVPDCAILASVTGASVIVVLKAGTPRRYAVQVRQRLSQLDVNVEGIVLNLVKPADFNQKYYTYQ